MRKPIVFPILLLLLAVWFLPAATTASSYPEYSGPIQLHKLRGFTAYARTLQECDIVDAKNFGANMLVLMIMVDDFLDYKGCLKPTRSKVNLYKLARITALVNSANKHGLFVLLSPHEFPGHVKYSCKWQERDCRLWDKKKGKSFQNMYVKTWKSLAKAFACYPPTCVGFKTGNELDPWYMDTDGYVRLDDSRSCECTSLHVKLHAAIRQTEARTKGGQKHLVVVEAPANYRMSSLLTWTPPDCFLDGNTALGIHFYEPIDFTHQDDAWWDRSIAPKTYPGWFAESWGDGNYQAAWWDAQNIRERLLLTAAEYQKTYGKLLPLFCSEIGAMKLAFGSGTYFWDTISVFKDLYIGWAAHCWREKAWLEAIGRTGEESMWDFEADAGRRGAIWAGMRNLQ